MIKDVITHKKRGKGILPTPADKVRFCLSIDPELVRFRLNEKKAKAVGNPYRLFKAPLRRQSYREHTLSKD
jgi:hypothetical protein